MEMEIHIQNIENIMKLTDASELHGFYLPLSLYFFMILMKEEDTPKRCIP